MNTPSSIRGYCRNHGEKPVPLELPEGDPNNPVCQLCKHNIESSEVHHR